MISPTSVLSSPWSRVPLNPQIRDSLNAYMVLTVPVPGPRS
jgi:hypothetical protein